MSNLNAVDRVGKMIFEDNKTAHEVAEIMNIPIGRVHSYKSYYKKRNNITVESKLANYEIAGKLHIENGLTIEEISRKTGFDTVKIRSYISKYRSIKGIPRRKKAEIELEEIKDEWDKWRLIVNPNAKAAEEKE